MFYTQNKSTSIKYKENFPSSPWLYLLIISPLTDTSITLALCYGTEQPLAPVLLNEFLSEVLFHTPFINHAVTDSAHCTV